MQRAANSQQLQKLWAPNLGQVEGEPTRYSKDRLLITEPSTRDITLSACQNKQNNHFETEGEAKVEGLEESKIPAGRTFDARNEIKQSMSINESFDARKRENNRRTHSMSFNFNGNPFHFRRTLSKPPQVPTRTKLAREMSIQK